MKSLAFLPAKYNLSFWLSGIFGITALYSLGLTRTAQASSLSCTPSPDLISSCSSGTYYFNTRADINVAFQNINFQAELNGKSQMFLGNPVDAIVNDPLLGNVGEVDGVLDVIPFEVLLIQVSTPNPLNPNLTIAARTGDQVSDLMSTPSDFTAPYESLYSAGAFVASSDPSQSYSLMNLSLEIEGTVLGTERNFSPFTITTVQPWTGIVPGQPIQYAGDGVVELFTSGSDQQFWTGDEFVGSRLVPGANIPPISVTFTPVSVPEPSTLWAAILMGVGFLVTYRQPKDKA